MDEINAAFLNAVRSGDINRVKHYLQMGADIHYSNDFPIKEAAVSGHINIVEHLIHQGCDIDIPIDIGTPEVVRHFSRYKKLTVLVDNISKTKNK